MTSRTEARFQVSRWRTSEAQFSSMTEAGGAAGVGEKGEGVGRVLSQSFCTARHRIQTIHRAFFSHPGTLQTYC